jgi:hypothetical protein
MSEFKIKRRTRSVPLAISSATATAVTLRMDDMAGGCVSVGVMGTAASAYQCWGSIDEDGPYYPVYDAGGEVAEIKLAPSSTDGRVYSLPDAVFAVPFVRIVASSASSTVATAKISFKS